MKTVDFTSSLSDEIAHFVKLKQHSGSDYYGSAKLLFKFDQYLVELPFNDKVLTNTIFQNYFQKIGHLCRRGFSNHYCVLQQFSAWLNQHKATSYILEKRLAIDRSYSRSAYIFSIDEIKTILESSGRFSEKEELVHGLYQTLFSLLYSTGIRIGEALALNHTDYIKRKNIIHIRQGKFRKERYVVLSSSSANRLNEYIEQYMTVLVPSDEMPLFVNIRRRRLTYLNAHLAFTKTIDKSGINKNGPRIHDFRHTFAVHRLLQWYETEQDINAKLPFLSTYMGHVNITSTQVYLEASSELLQAGCERFNKFFLNHIK